MELLDRYLHAIEFWLPKDQKRDIIAELSEDIHSQTDEQEAALGRAMNRSELEALLKKRGAPVVVANHYLPQRHLIGPLLFPIYAFVLEIVVFGFLAPSALLYLLIGHALHPTESWANVVIGAIGSLWTSAFASIAATTLAFAILELLEPRFGFLHHFNPRNLPAVRDPRAISRTSAAFEFAIYLAVIPWWITFAEGPQVLGFLTLSSNWGIFFWGFFATSLANATLAAINFVNRHWTLATAMTRLAIDVCGSALFLWMLKANVVASAGTTEHTQLVHSVINQSVPWAVLVTLIILAGNGYRLFQLTRRQTEMPQLAANSQ